MKKILLCTSSLTYTHTGAAVFAQLLVEWAAKKSIQIDIITPEINSDHKVINLVKHQRMFTKLPVLQSYHRSFIYYKTVKHQIASIKVKKEVMYDLIFFNSAVESLHSAKLIHDIPVWAFLHDENFMNDYLQNPSWKRRLYRSLMKRHEGKAIQFLQKVLTNSRYMKNSISQIYEKHAINVQYCYFRSYDLPGSIENKPEIAEKETIRILFIKHDAARGGLDLLLNAISNLTHRKIELHIVGVEHSYLKKKEMLLKGISYRHDPYLSREKLHQAYTDADIFCVPSFSEALGLANFEALQYGIPIVVQDIPTMRELVNIQPMFFLSEADKLGETLEYVIGDVEARSEKRKAGQLFLDEQLERDVVFHKLDAIFQM